MALFDSPSPNSSTFFEGDVVAVDIVRKACQIKTSFGQNMNSVVWCTPNSPQFGDRVFLTTATGTPIILGILPNIGADVAYAVHIDSPNSAADTGNYTSMGYGIVADPNKPGDIIAGDQIISNDAGGLYGLLKGGSFLAKASRLAQIFLTKYDDLVRIVGRNFELFTDLGIDTFSSVRGRVYRFVGYADTPTNAMNDVYKYQEYYGDTVLAATLKGQNYGLDPTSFAALPAQNTTIKEYTVQNASGQPLMTSTTDLDGHILTTVQNASGSLVALFNHTNSLIDTKVTGAGGYTEVTHNGASITATYNGTHTVVIDSAGIRLDYSGGSHFVHINSSGVHMG